MNEKIVYVVNCCEKEVLLKDGWVDHRIYFSNEKSAREQVQLLESKGYAAYYTRYTLWDEPFIYTIDDEK